MYGLRRFGIKLGLSTIKNILKGLGNPQDNFECIHVAGTNGKGSVAAALASILHVAGYHVGLYTSPHLIRFNERIRINEQQITNDDVVAAYQAVRRVHYGQREPTFFEFATAMALYEFGRQNVDWAVIETGMGGRLDATNMIKPALSVITNVSLEHRDYLGNTLSQIAREKAGIPKDEKIDIVQLPEAPLFNPEMFAPKLFGIEIKESTADRIVDHLKFRIDHNGQPMPLLPLDQMDYVSEDLETSL